MKAGKKYRMGYLDFQPEQNTIASTQLGTRLLRARLEGVTLTSSTACIQHPGSGVYLGFLYYRLYFRAQQFCSSHPAPAQEKENINRVMWEYTDNSKALFCLKNWWRDCLFGS